MDKKDMRRLIAYGNAYSKNTKRKLSAITVEECLLDFREVRILNHTAVAVPVLDYQKLAFPLIVKN